MIARLPESEWAQGRRSAHPRRAGPRPLYIDLFAGAGGFSLGLAEAGFGCFGAIERDARAAETYRLNFPEHADAPLTRLGPALGDITKLTEAEVRAALRDAGHPEIAVIAGGPPCQGFSRVGRGKLDSLAKERGAFHRDPRNRLYLKYMDILEWVQPRAFIFENVAGIMHVRGQNVAELVCMDAESRGYEVRCALLNAAWYGVPQSRERVIILGVRKDIGIEPSFPTPLCYLERKRGHLSGESLSTDTFWRPAYFVRVSPPADALPPVTVREALGDLPPVPLPGTGAAPFVSRRLREPVSYGPGRPSRFASLMRNWDPEAPSTAVHDHSCRHNPRDYRIFARMQHNDCYPQAVSIAERLYEEARRREGPHVTRAQYIPPYSQEGFDEKWQMLDPDKPSWTVTAHLSKDCYSHIHYDQSQSRTISIREAARLQSFPDSFRFAGGMGDRFRQIGNAVPPLMAFAIAEALIATRAR